MNIRMVATKHALLQPWGPLLLWLILLNDLYIGASVAQNEKIMACYFRSGKYLYFPGSSVDPFLCTHVICAGGVVTPDGLKTELPIDMEQYKEIAKLKEKNPNLKVMVSVSHNFKQLVDNPSDDFIHSFAVNAIMFLEQLNMDGLDLDWEVPEFIEKERFIFFMKTLSSYLHSSNMLISLALPADPKKFEGIDIHTVNEYMDFVTVMTYGYNGFSTYNLTSYSSALYTVKGEPLYKSVAGTITYVLYKGLSPHKVLMGVPTYGGSYTLANPDVNGLHSQAISAGAPGPYSHGPGMVIHADVCALRNEGAKLMTDDIHGGEYLYNGSYWANFDWTFSLTKKMQWLKKRDLAGIGIWAYQFDDVYNFCKDGYMPLLNFLKSLLFK